MDRLFREHGADVARFIRRLLGRGTSPADADDLVQQVFIAVHRDLGNFRGDSSVRTWLFALAYRAVLMHIRANERRRRALHAFSHTQRATTGSAANPELRVSHKQELDRVLAALEAVAPAKRVVFLLYEGFGWSGKEISDRLGIPEATVWTRLFSIRRELSDTHSIAPRVQCAGPTSA